MRGTSFAETLLGTVRLDSDDHDRRIRLDLRAEADEVLLPHRTTTARLNGRLRITGFADDPRTQGTMQISPLARRRIRYRLSFTTGDRRTLTLDGWKSVTARHPVKSMTVLPVTLYEDGARIGTGTLRFPAATGLLPFLLSFRFPGREEAARYAAPRWDGRPGRTEVWYTTVTDPATGTGVWLHHELTVPTDGSPPTAHGWVATFPREGKVRHARFGPAPWPSPAEGFSAVGVTAVGGQLSGSADDFSWDLTENPLGAPLFTFPRWSWRRSLLPATHLLPASRAAYSGTLHDGERTLTLRDAPGASARIYGHGNARRWAWLHADLGDGDVLEVVAAVSTRPLLRRLPPLVFLRLKHRGRTWPSRPERSAAGLLGIGRFRARIGLPEWTVTGRTALRRVRVTVTQPADRTLALDYRDPDGAPAVCRNSERSDAEVVLERWWGRWRTEAVWTLDGTAHAEVGDR
ncbi:hypothetical protein [Streptomyces sp. NPDC096152]|uniref:hypothetical protein n=1 Tax=Streptomyces sp. NPDC096152 TaxID=3366078 RepID=UPI003820CFAB